MTMRPDHDTIHKVEHLIDAAAARDTAGVDDLIMDLVDSDDDAYQLMMLLGMNAARLAHAMHHLAGQQVHAVTDGVPPPDQTAVALIVHLANDEPQKAKDLARNSTGSIAYAQQVLRILAYLAGTHPDVEVHVVHVHDMAPLEDRRN